MQKGFQLIENCAISSPDAALSIDFSKLTSPITGTFLMLKVPTETRKGEYAAQHVLPSRAQMVEMERRTMTTSLRAIVDGGLAGLYRQQHRDAGSLRK